MFSLNKPYLIGATSTNLTMSETTGAPPNVASGGAENRLKKVALAILARQQHDEVFTQPLGEPRTDGMMGWVKKSYYGIIMVYHGIYGIIMVIYGYYLFISDWWFGTFGLFFHMGMGQNPGT